MSVSYTHLDVYKRQKMNLANMVIDSDDNVEIVEETKEDKYKENKVEGSS